jgi:hypothetical protein
MAPTSSAFPAIPSQVVFVSVDRSRPGLTAMGYERQVADHVEPELMGRAVARVYRRHEALRTTTVATHRDIDPASPDYFWLGLRNLVAEQPVVSFECISSAEPGADFPGEPGWLPGIRTDPSCLPVFRFQLISRAEDRVLRIVTDHALCDRWSLFALQRDIERAYKHELEQGPASDPDAYPFSAFAASMYSAWTAGLFDEAISVIEKEVPALDMQALPGTGEQPSGTAWIKAFVVSLGADSTSRFEAACARLKTTRLALALALFAGAVGAEFGWRRLAWWVPHANRSARTLNSVGLFADSQYVFTALEAGFEMVVREIAASLEDARVRVPPPAALVRAWPTVRDKLRTAPRLAADVQINPRRRGSRRPGTAEIFVEKPVVQPRDSEEDVIVASSPPSFPGQPDLRLTCDFSQRHSFSVNFRVDHIAHAAARSIAERLLHGIRGLSA